MIRAASLPLAILETILTHLAGLFLVGAAGDLVAAHDAAGHMLGSYDPQTEDDLRLAARIISCSFQVLEALAQAATPDMPITRVLRLRGGAVSLSRASDKAERRLEQLQKARRLGIAVQPPAERHVQPHAATNHVGPNHVGPNHVGPEARSLVEAEVKPEPKIAKAMSVVEETRATIAAAKARGLTWTQAHAERRRNMAMAARRERTEAAATPRPNPTMSNPATQTVVTDGAMIARSA